MNAIAEVVKARLKVLREKLKEDSRKTREAFQQMTKLKAVQDQTENEINTLESELRSMGVEVDCGPMEIIQG